MHALPFRFAALADTHLAEPETLVAFRDFLHRLRQDGDVDFLLILGDICGHAPDRLPLIRNLADHAGLPVHALPGNHDDDYGHRPEWFESSWGPSSRAFTHHGWRFLLHGGPADDDAWIGPELDALPAGMPAIVCRHYPPDGAQSAASHPAWRRMAADPRIRLVLCGHTHVEHAWLLDGLVSLTQANAFFLPGSPCPCYIYEVTADAVRLAERRPGCPPGAPTAPDDLPQVAMLAPRDGDRLDGPLACHGTASADVRRIDMRIDRGAWIPARLDGARWDCTFALPPGDGSHHLIDVRAADARGRLSLCTPQAIVAAPERPLPPGCVRLRNGLDGYAGCTDLTLRRQPPQPDTDPDDLECWIHHQGTEVVEFCEFQLRFDLTTLKGTGRLAAARLRLHCNRQNGIGGPDRPSCYHIARLTGQSAPAWAIHGAWPIETGHQDIVPPRPVDIDLAALLPTLHDWIDDPASNHGLVITPAATPDPCYNQSFRSSRCRVPSLRPELELIFVA